MIKKLSLCMMLLLLIMRNGWTQSSKWTVWENNSDTVITYNFFKEDLLGLRLYVTDLEKYKELYEWSIEYTNIQDSLLSVKNSEIVLKDSIILLNNKWIDEQKIEYNKLLEINSNVIKSYNRQKRSIPFIAGGSAAITLIVCLILSK